MVIWIGLSISISEYYICLVANGVYNHQTKKLHLNDYCVMLMIFLIGAGISVVVKDKPNKKIVKD